MICPYYPDPVFFFFAESVPALLYYSHFVSIICSLFLGIFVFTKNPKNGAARALFWISLLFSTYTLLNLITWTNNESNTIMFVWSLFGIFYTLTCAASLYFTYAFIDQKSPSSWVNIAAFLLILPVIIFAPSQLNFETFDLVLCAAVEKTLYANYYYFVGFTFFVWVAVLLVHRYLTTTAEKKKVILAFGAGILLFLFAFFFTGYLSSVILFNSYNIEFYGLLSVTFFVGVLAYLITRFQIFNIKLIATQALVTTMALLVGSMLFVAQSNTTKIVAAATLLFTTFAGYLLIKSVQNEVRQREELEKLTVALGKANERLKELDTLKSEFVSIASHQLRSPLTSIRGYASMLVEESFGKLPEKALEPLKRIEDSARHMAMSIEDYLNVSRIEAGNMKYNLSEFNLREEVEKISDDVRPVAMEKGLVLLFRTDMKGQGVVKADIGKTVQIIHNLINNSMKYTPKGSITVLVHDDIQKKRIYVDIIDTGIGINKENLSKLFQKFSRADNANSVNVSGTGLGLFVALRMAEAMGGNITAHSDGDGKGSKFTLELPLSL